MKIKIWEVTATDNVRTELIEDVFSIDIKPIVDIYASNEYDDIHGLEYFELIYLKDGKTYEKEISKNSMFKLKENTLEIEINDY